MPDINLLYGDEDFLIDEEVKSLRGKYPEFNIERIDGSREGIGRIISALSSVPMLAGDRLVEIDDLEYDEEEENELFDAIKSLSGNVKVLFVNYSGIDKRRKFYKLIEGIGRVKEFKRLSQWEQDKALAWIVNRVRHYGKKINGRAANMLIEIVGLSLRMLDKEIEKIATFIGERGTIEEPDVLRLASSGEKDSFALSNALRDRNVKEAVDSLSRLLHDNEDPHMIIGMLASLYRMLLQVKCLETEGMDQNEIAGKLKAKPFFIRKCMESTANFSKEELMNNMKLLHHADLKMKSGYSPKLTLEMLVPQLCEGKHAGR